MNRQDFIPLLEQHISAKYKTLAFAAAKWMCSTQYVRQMLNGVNPPSDKALKDMGYVKKVGETTYHKKGSKK